MKNHYQAGWIACTDGDFFVCRPQGANGVNSGCPGNETQIGGVYTSFGSCLDGQAWCSCNGTCKTYSSSDGYCCSPSEESDYPENYFTTYCPEPYLVCYDPANANAVDAAGDPISIFYCPGSDLNGTFCNDGDTVVSGVLTTRNPTSLSCCFVFIFYRSTMVIGIIRNV